MRDYKDPIFVDSIISAINEKKLILFIGAGFSKLCGLPLWNDLAIMLINACIKDNEIELNYADKDLIIRNKDAKTLITIAYYLFEEKDKTNTFYRLLYDFLSNFDKDPNTTKRRKKLIELVSNSGATVLTTNSDNILHNCFSDENFIQYRLDDVYKFRVNSHRQLLHLHGYKGDMSSMVFTVKDYLERYADEKFKNVIKEIFNSDYTILFLGYGLNEMQLLDFLIDKTNTMKNRFVLDGFFLHEEADFKARQHYFKSFDLQLISYSRDENDYFELVNAIDFLVQEANTKSTIKSETYLQAIDLLKQKPNNKKIHQFNNTLMILSDEKKLSILRSLVKSDYRNDWIRYIHKYDYFNLFSVEKYIESKNSSLSDSRLDIPIFPILEDIYLKEKTDAIYRIIRDLLIKVIKYPQINDSFKKDTYLSGILSRLIFSDCRFINKKPILQFLIDLLEDTSTNFDMLRWVTYNSSELNKAYKKNRLDFNKSILKHYNNNLARDFHFNDYVYKFGNKLSEDYPNEVFIQLKQEFNNLNSKNYGLFSEVGSLISYLETTINARDDYSSIILRWFVLTIKLIDDSKIIKLFKEFYGSKVEIESKIALLLLNDNFDLLIDPFLDTKTNPFNIWVNYSDLYLIIDYHWNDLSIENNNIIKSYIENMSITNVSSFYSLACKMDLLELIGNKLDEKDSLKMAVSIKETFSAEEKNKYIQFTEPTLRNRKSWSTSYTIKDDEVFKADLYQKSITDFLNAIAGDLDDFQNHTVRSIYIDYFNKNNFVDWVSKENYTNFDKINSKNYVLIVQYLLTSESRVSFDIITEVMKRIETNIGDSDELKKVISVFISELHFKYIKKIDNDDDYQMIYDYCYSIYERYDLRWKIVEDSNKEITNTSLLVVEAYQMLTILIVCAYHTENLQFFNLLDFELTNSEFVGTVKAIIVANIGYLWKKDSDWVRRKIEDLFDNIVNNQNFSIIAYQLSFYVEGDFIDALFEKGIFECIINSKNLVSQKWAFIHNLLANINSYANADKILDNIGRTDNNFGGINSYFSVLKKVEDLSKLEGTINLICERLASYYKNRVRSSGILIKNLLLIYPKLSNKTKLWSFILAVVPYHGTHYTKEINNVIAEIDIDNEYLLKFVEHYISSLTDHFYRLNDIYNLINMANWKGKKDKRREIINKVGEINPEIWELEKRNNSD